MNDLTILYYTSNNEPEYFIKNTQDQLLRAVGDTPIVSVSFKKTVIGNNCTNLVLPGSVQRSVYLLYWQVLMAARQAKTKYVATAEDDMLYSAEHFQHRPADNVFAYDLSKWSIFSWVEPPIFSYRPRKLMNSLITTKEALVRTLEQRYDKYPSIDSIPADIYKYYWGEPGRFEDHLGIDKLATEEYIASVPSIMFSTSEALGYLYLGKRKAHSTIQANEVIPWGKAEQVLKYYKP